MRFSFLKFSRKAHKWLGIYVSFLTVVWLGELLLLPLAYPVKGTQAVEPATVGIVAVQGPVVPFHEIMRRVKSGAYGPFGPDLTVTYLPRDGRYVVRDPGTFVVCTVSATDGRLLGRESDGSALFTEKGALAWLNPAVSTILKAPFEISFVILAVTGVYLVIFPYLRRGRAVGEGVLGLVPGDRFFFRATGNARDMARLAALGLLPGVRVTLLRMPRRGPVVLSARNTRIAVARNVAAAFIIERAEA